METTLSRLRPMGRSNGAVPRCRGGLEGRRAVLLVGAHGIARYATERPYQLTPGSDSPNGRGPFIMTRAARKGWHALLPLLTLLASLSCASCVFVRIFYYNVPNLSAPHYFEERLVPASSHPLPFERQREPAAFAMRESQDQSFGTFEDLLSANHTRALLVLHHDVIVYERYFGGVTARDPPARLLHEQDIRRRSRRRGDARRDHRLGAATPRRVRASRSRRGPATAASLSSTSCE